MKLRSCAANIVNLREYFRQNIETLWQFDSLLSGICCFIHFSCPFVINNSSHPLTQSNVNALIDMKLEKHKNLREESAFYWREISDGTFKFDRRECEVWRLSPLLLLPSLISLCNHLLQSIQEPTEFYAFGKCSFRLVDVKMIYFTGCSAEATNAKRPDRFLRRVY